MCLSIIFIWVGVCKGWSSGWSSWNLRNEWLEWYPNYYLEGSQWTLWDDGYYYSPFTNAWTNCEGSWKDKCAYRDEWHECNQEQYLDLDSYQWVEKCEEYVLDDIRAWRGSTIYVNSESEEVIELGTKAYPYKELSYAFLELMNYHSHSNRNITIYVKENTINYLSIGNSYIVNITQVMLETYTNKESKALGKATIIGIDSSAISSHPGTLYSILNSYTLNISSAIYDSIGITEAEKSIVNSESSLIFVVRSSFHIANFEISSSYESRATSNIFIYPLYLQDKTVALRNLNVNTQGAVLVAKHPLNLHLENLDVDLARSSGGLDIIAYCGYPEAALDGLVYFNNFTLYFGSEREILPFEFYSLRYIGPARIEAIDFTLSIPKLESESDASFYFQPDSNWIPDSYQRFYNYTNLKVIPSYPNGNFNTLSSMVSDDIYVQNIFNISTISIESSALESSLIYIIGFWTMEMYITNFTIVNWEFNESPIRVVLFSKLEIDNVSVQSISLNKVPIIYFDYATQVKIKNVKINDLNAYGDTKEAIFYINTLPYGNLDIEDWTVTNSTIQHHDLLKMSSIISSGSLIVSSLHVSQTQVGSTILKAGSLNSFLITSSNFTDIASYDYNDKAKFIVYVSTIDLMQYGVYSINNIIVDNSEITFFTVNTINSNNIEGKRLELSWIKFFNFYNKFSKDIVEFQNFESNSDFSIVLSNIEASNIIYDIPGNLFKFRQQTITPLILKD